MIVFAQKILVNQGCTVFSASFISDIHRKPKGEVKGAYLADILLLTARLADTSSFEDAFIPLPFEDSKGSKANTAFLAKIFFEHSHIGVFSVASITCDGKIGAFPSLLVDACASG